MLHRLFLLLHCGSPLSKPGRMLLAGLIFGSLSGMSAQGGETASSSSPNVVVILADDLGYGDVQSLNPDSKIPTPNLNRLAAAGMTFTDAHSPSAVCTPTRYGLLTGRYCWRSSLKRGVLGGYSQPLIEPQRSTIADRLQAAGYATGAIGKWHLGMALPMLEANERADVTKWDGDPGVDFQGTIADGPMEHGFGTCFGVTASLDMPPYVFVHDHGFASQPTLQQAAVKFPHFVRAGPRSEDFVIDEVLDRLTAEAVGFVTQQAPLSQPYFLYLPLTGPHKPTQPHPRFRGKTELGEYGDFVHQVDWTVGQVLDAIDTSGEAENTLVFFTSDNGSYMYRYEDQRPDHVQDATVQGFRAEHHRANGPWRGTKADIWEAGHRVPCFVRWPANVEPGTQCAATVCHVDLYATIMDFVGLELGDGEAEDSVSWRGLLMGTANSRGAPVIHHSGSGMFAIREGDWKLVLGNGSGGREQPRGKPFEPPYQLFHLADDPQETTDVAAQHADVVARLTEKLHALRGE